MKSAAPTPPPVVSEIVSLLVDRAKLDRKGAFWAPAAPHRQSGAAVAENSLAFGTPGIVLALLEYYRLTRDPEIAELIRKAGAWVAHRLETAPFQHGYYAGTAGLWVLCAELEPDFPELAPRWPDQARAALAALKPGDPAGGLASGVAGTIVGLLGLPALDAAARAELPPLLAGLLGAAKLSPRGVFWDFNPTSIRPPAGFFQGNAGVDFCLAQLQHRRGLAFKSILAGSLSHADSLFDATRGNWLDQDAAARLGRLQPKEIEEMIARGESARFAATITPEDTLTWATGTAGILLGRCAVAAACPDHAVGRAAREDCQRAVRRLAATTDGELRQFDSTLLQGLPGLALTLEAVRTSLPADIPFAPLQPLRESVRMLVAEMSPPREGDDFSLCSGAAGLAYARLKLMGDSPSRHCLQPLELLPAGHGQTAERPGDLTPLLARRLPAAGTLPEVQAALAESVVHLGTVSSAVAARLPYPGDELLTRSIQHEISLYEQLASTRFQELFWHELVKRSRFARRYAEGMDDNLLFERFRLDDTVTLLELDFDPYARTAQSAGQKLAILRHATSAGITEIRLSALQHALVAGFRTPAVALDVIRTVIRRIETPNVTQRQLADLARKIVRSFVQSGYLAADTPGRIQAWAVRQRLKETRRNLFPAAPAAC